MKEKKREWLLLPNEVHRAERWSGGRVTRNKKKYTRKDKHKGRSRTYD